MKEIENISKKAHSNLTQRINFENINILSNFEKNMKMEKGTILYRGTSRTKEMFG